MRFTAAPGLTATRSAGRWRRRDRRATARGRSELRSSTVPCEHRGTLNCPQEKDVKRTWREERPFRRPSNRLSGRSKTLNRGARCRSPDLSREGRESGRLRRLRAHSAAGKHAGDELLRELGLLVGQRPRVDDHTALGDAGEQGRGACAQRRRELLRTPARGRER